MKIVTWKMLKGIDLYDWQKDCLEEWLKNESGTIKVATGARVIIVTGCINVIIVRVSEIFIKKNHALLRVIRYNCCK